MGEDGEAGERRVPVERVEEAQRLAVGHVELEDHAVEGVGGQCGGRLPRTGRVDDLEAAPVPRGPVSGGEVPVGALGDEGEQAALPLLDHQQRRAWRWAGRGLPEPPASTVVEPPALGAADGVSKAGTSS